MGNNSFKTYRQRAGLSQKDVALKLNVSQGAVSAWESGRNRPDIEMAQKVANLYNVSVDELISSDQQPRLWKPINVELVPDDSDGSDFIPLVASLRCGWGSNGDAFTVIKKVEVSSSYKRKWGPDIKIVEAEGNSMLTTIRPGDYLSSEYDELSETKKNILRQIRSDNHISAALIAEKFSLSSRAVEKNIKQLREDGFLLRKGSARGGYWLVLK